ncbi:MAG TPA: hypothetical protein VFF79_00725 [Conexibacter sp.]|jgi:hypothetical protein|nr:hypothetical protein [Conexibacter sp.]
MRLSIPLRTLVLCVLLLALPAASASANATDDRIVQDCQHSATGALTGSYTKAQLRHALHNLPGDVQEYSGCHDAIAQAASAGSGHSGAGGGSGGGSNTAGGGGAGTGGAGSSGSGGGGAGGTSATGPTTDAQPPAGAERPLQVAGAAVAPGTLPAIGRDSHKLPTALLVVLALLGLTALASTALTIGRRAVAHRRP